MSARMRKLLGTVVIVAWVLAYVAVAAAIGDELGNKPWWTKLIYFPIAGLGWIIPLRPLLKWMHARDEPAQSPDV